MWKNGKQDRVACIERCTPIVPQPDKMFDQKIVEGCPN